MNMRRTLMIRALRLAVAAGAGCALALAHLTGGGISWEPLPAKACGLGNSPTMKANSDLALSRPFLPTDKPGAPIGVFALAYVVNQPIAFTEDLSQLASPLNTADYGWNWSFGDGGTATGFSATHTYTKPGTYDVHLGIVDPKNSQNSDPNFDSSQITIAAQPYTNPPVAVAKGSAHYVQVGGTVTYDATGSHSLDGGPLTYTWNFGDAQTTAGPHVTHTFSRLGKGNVALIVQDDQGNRSYALVPVFVAAQLPTAKATASATHVTVGTSIHFDASASQPTDQPGDEILNYQWDFGDGTVRTTTTPAIDYSYDNAGTYTVTIEAINKIGLPGTTTLQITVTNGLLNLHNPLVRLGLGLIALIVLLSIVGNWIRTWRENRARLAYEAARRARSDPRRRRSPYRYDDDYR
jgi:PKD repeat protein